MPLAKTETLVASLRRLMLVVAVTMLAVLGMPSTRSVASPSQPLSPAIRNKIFLC